MAVPPSSLPDVPERLLDDGGWTLVEEREETLFRLPTARVRGYTTLYEDGDLREGIERVADVDRQWRFFFATRLSFIPPLAPGVGPAMLTPTVQSEARRRFADDLRERGFEAVSRGRTERIRVRSGGRAYLQSFEARLPVGVAGVETVDVEGWLGVWTTTGEFRLAGGAYPTDLPGLGDALGVPDLPDASECREELWRLIRAVE
ncbi:hypothetical protein [Halomarina litorea]|uniref:hypothetical protein n=1 Tax=Halomarina litorea TaxID=2961595 RepID=UPI0020C567CA|nr:hypothetical protein [Halomarina sp. BCD28]